jgi:hypothetical protein
MLKELNLHDGNGVEMSITNFNDKLQATNFEVKKGTTSIIKRTTNLTLIRV